MSAAGSGRRTSPADRAPSGGASAPARPLAVRSGAERAASRLPPLLAEAERVAATAAQGAHGRRRVGSGDAFWQFRRYENHDAPSMIDWRRSARSDAVFVRENEWEAAQSVWLWRDGTPSMNYRSDPTLPTKRERADVLALALAILLTRGGERVAPYGGGDRPTGGRFAVERMTEHLTAAHSTAAAAFRLDGPPPPRFGHAVLLGDFLDLHDSTLENCVRDCAGRGVRGVLLQVLDPAEEDLPFSGRVRLNGMEGEASLLIPRVEDLRGDYQRRLADRRDHLRALARAASWGFAVHRTDKSPQTALLALWAATAGRNGGINGGGRNGGGRNGGGSSGGAP